jgi:hypothetical protein
LQFIEDRVLESLNFLDNQKYVVITNKRFYIGYVKQISEKLLQVFLEGGNSTYISKVSFYRNQIQSGKIEKTVKHCWKVVNRMNLFRDDEVPNFRISRYEIVQEIDINLPHQETFQNLPDIGKLISVRSSKGWSRFQVDEHSPDKRIAILSDKYGNTNYLCNMRYVYNFLERKDGTFGLQGNFRGYDIWQKEPDFVITENKLVLVSERDLFSSTFGRISLECLLNYQHHVGLPMRNLPTDVDSVYKIFSATRL